MRRVRVFENVSLDGYFCDERGDMSWAHRSDPEWNTFVAENASGESQLVFGRVTYQMMAGYWPTPMAFQQNPRVAERMSATKKYVCSRSLSAADLGWQNSELVSDLVSGVQALKREAGPDLVILGSGSLVAQLSEAGLVDEYQVVLQPIVLGKGKSLFSGVTHRIPLTLKRSRCFGNGNAVLWYEPSVG
ncbi:MAG TPA: dihydrofolate reductase family protein [Polyangiaceae bacterium]|nr:dihydrofolate reductase family protein [Polyangiaceae bacterium]